MWAFCESSGNSYRCVTVNSDFFQLGKSSNWFGTFLNDLGTSALHKVCGLD